MQLDTAILADSDEDSSNTSHAGTGVVRLPIKAGTLAGLAARAGVLATIGATAPFVGLFGTVLGIMTAFAGISRAQTTNLAVVAPGIAGALLATALELVAAIPAVAVYNLCVRAMAAHRLTPRDGAALIARMASRTLNAQARARCGGRRHAPRQQSRRLDRLPAPPGRQGLAAVVPVRIAR